MRRNQSGIFLVSAAIAITIVGMLITFWGVNQMRQMRIERAERAGHGLRIIGNAADTIVAKYYKDIESLLSTPGKTFAIKGHTFTHEPASSSFDYSYIGRLDAAALLAVLDISGVGSKPPHGLGDYGIRIYRKCDREKPPNCQINSLTYLTEPAKRAYSSEPDYAFAAIVAKTVGVFGGTSTMDKPQEFRFVDESMKPIPDTVPNPLGKPGLVAMRGGYLTHSLDVNVRRDGSRNITGDLDFENGNSHQSIKGIKNIVGVGKLSMMELEIAGQATMKGPLHLSDKGKNRQDIVGARNIEGDGMLTMKGLEVQGATVKGDATILGSLDAKRGATVGGTLKMERHNIERAGRVTAQSLQSDSGVIRLDRSNRQNASCQAGEIGRDADGKMLSCQSSGGSWTWQLARTTEYVTRIVHKEVERIVEKDRPIVMATWDYYYNRCNDYRMSGGWKTGYYGKIEGALFCSIVAKGWCDRSAFGSNERATVYNADNNGRQVTTGGTPYVFFGNTYGVIACGFSSERDAKAAGFTVCDSRTNNCRMAKDL
ncbi:shufflon system plasmid conjugative transfer pilus tip adhesin PilV [Pandoraea sp. XJJ-1]|uniref:shufflon system plasmid conjugative transfer pilus tip adhesin PilV n=1 Tax=unclassified Pandoraea TaxID=2624094 RepID=UPI0009634638|nr:MULTISPECIES: shufflon system plasmid conjugative transfer pilus tip adhesin PilV [unclassified Pandoraea]OJY24380.1 MAG: hypothetical protein BGP02_11540 [Pandoraea sp. 64-18]WAL82767.1 shufflon system plasmid conjugative transfer pilus tip adhesin PilV [Pandoraea sp. XJJ-1]BDD92163.1 hypothetical protein PanNE5_16030 [Pandoraea sp. NE5]